MSNLGFILLGVEEVTLLGQLCLRQARSLPESFPDALRQPSWIETYRCLVPSSLLSERGEKERSSGIPGPSRTHCQRRKGLPNSRFGSFQFSTRLLNRLRRERSRAK